MTFPPIGGLASGMTRRRYALLTVDDHNLIARLRQESALPVAAIAALLCTTETAVNRVCEDRQIKPRYTGVPYRRRSKRQSVS